MCWVYITLLMHSPQNMHRERERASSSERERKRVKEENNNTNTNTAIAISSTQLTTINTQSYSWMCLFAHGSTRHIGSCGFNFAFVWNGKKNKTEFESEKTTTTTLESHQAQASQPAKHLQIKCSMKTQRYNTTRHNAIRYNFELSAGCWFLQGFHRIWHSLRLKRQNCMYIQNGLNVCKEHLFVIFSLFAPHFRRRCTCYLKNGETTKKLKYKIAKRERERANENSCVLIATWKSK